MDMTDQFDKRLEILNKARACKRSEIDAAVATFERLKTAKTICASLLPDSSDQAALMTIFSELSAEARSGQSTKLDE